MNNKENSFNSIDASQSIEIYRQLTQGKVILKKNYNELRNELEENSLYTVLFKHWKHFSSLYQHIGYKLEFHDAGNFYYLRDVSDTGIDEADNNAFKIQVALLLIGRYFSRTGRNLELLFIPDAGFDEKDIEELKNDNEYSEILKTARFNRGWDDALEFLIKRNFAFRTSPTSYFISDAGKAFLEQLIEMYESN
ncbi:condensin complex protein MksE [Thiothrix eikelboomii]|uniref:condensin complex protein MksE n=1 Tax=Thiothrix eikelboomii TaxID=92487 RepID=UPI003BB062BB